MLLFNNLPKFTQLVQLMKLQNNLCKFVVQRGAQSVVILWLNWQSTAAPISIKTTCKSSETFDQIRLVSLKHWINYNY